MTTLDDQIRDLLRDGLADSPTPLTAHEIADRHLVPSGEAPEPTGRRLWPALVLVAAACLALVVSTTSRGREADERQAAASIASSPPADLAFAPPALILPEMPDGWVLVDAQESVGPGDWGNRVAIYTRVDPPARLEISYVPGAGTTLANETPFTFADGEGSWNPVSSGSWSGVALDVVHGGEYLSAQGLGIESESEVRAIAESLSIGDDGLPRLDPSSGFELHAAAQGASASIDRVLRYVRPDDPEASITFVARSGPGLLDADLSAGSFVEPLELGGRRLWVGPDGHEVHWSARGDRFSLYGRPGNADLVAIGAAARTVGSDQFDATIRAIGADGQVLGTEEIELVGRDLVLQERAVGTSSLVCLFGRDARVCRSIGQVGISPSDVAVSLLLDGRWYVIQSSDGGPVPTPVAETVDGPTWRVSAVADDVATVRIERSETEWYDLPRPLW